MPAGRLFAADALLPTGWARDVLLEWDAAGVLRGVRPLPERESELGGGVRPLPSDSPGARSDDLPHAAGPVVPGVPNLHSHAFQRVFAGLTEFRASASDDFWSWREAMYRAANAVTPEAIEVIAAYVYAEMLAAGYTSVCEFHYLHLDVDGRPYADDARLSHAIVRAADRVGIGLTLLPVLYQQGGFGAQPPSSGQRRFLRSTDALMRLVEAMRPPCEAIGGRVGLALHSLRAVTPEAMQDALAGLDALDAAAPIHIHVAEQRREVEDCVAWSGRRPVEWLLAHAPLGPRWCLVHATHLTPEESARASATGAVAGLCPTTEANLGDGIFDWPAWTAVDGARGGRWGLGSDSHVTVDPWAEMRMLEYGQRLHWRRRNIGATAAEPHTATALTLAAVAGGAQASGRPIGGLAEGQSADFVVLGPTPLTTGLDAPSALATHVFATPGASVRDVWVGGRQVVAEGHHAARAAAARDFARIRATLATPRI